MIHNTTISNEETFLQDYLVDIDNLDNPEEVIPQYYIQSEKFSMLISSTNNSVTRAEMILRISIYFLLR